MVASSNTADPSICIFGATGVQGGSVLEHLIKSDKPYRIRAVTRDPSKPNAQSIAAQGVEVVKAELGDQQDVENAVKEQDMVFGVTNFWEHGKDKELADGKRLMDAAKAANVKTVYWSGLVPISKLSKGKYTKVEHFDSKASILEYALDNGIPVIDVQPAMYMENFLTLMPPRKQEDGSFVFGLPVDPESTLSLINCSSDYGAFVRGAIESGLQQGGEILACGDEITPSKLAEVWSSITGKKAAFYQIDPQSFEQMAGEETTQMLQWFNEFGYYGGKDVQPSKKFLASDEHVNTWEAFVKASDWSKILA